MWKCQCRILCLVVIGLATRRVSSMNEQPPSKNDSQESISANSNSDDKTKLQHDESDVKNKNQLLSNSVATASANAGTNSSSFNGSAALVIPADVSGNSIIDAARSRYNEEARSKHHFHRSKSYHKESRTSKSPASSTKNNIASGNSIPFNFEHVVAPPQNILHSSNNKSDSVKTLDSMPKTSSTSPHTVESNHDYSVSKTSTRSSNSSGGSKYTNDQKLNNLSSRISASSGSTENWNYSSSSSDGGSLIDEKTSSVELMTFTFDNVDGVGKSTSANEMTMRVENSTASTSMTKDHPSSTTIASVQKSDEPIDKQKFSFAERISGVIAGGESIQSFGNEADDNEVYSVHTESGRIGKLSLVSVTSEALKSFKNTSSKGERTRDKSGTASLKSNSNVGRTSVDGGSWVSVNDSFNRISLTDVADNLQSLNSREGRRSHSYSNSTISQNSNSSLESKIRIPNTDRTSVKHSRSITVPQVSQRLRKSHPSVSSDPEIKFSNESHPAPVSSLTEEAEQPFRLMIPLNIEAILKARTKNHLVTEYNEPPRRSTSQDLASGKKSLGLNDADNKDEPIRLVLNLNSSSLPCSSDSQTDRLENSQSYDPFNERRSHTVSNSGNNISEQKQCLSRLSSAQTSLNMTNGPETLIELPVISSNSEQSSNASLESRKSEAKVTRSSTSEIADDHRGAQSLLSSGFIILENIEPVVHEALTPEEVAVVIETETSTSGHFFAGCPDPAEHCNASLFDVFIPSINSRESIAKDIPGEESSSVRQESNNLNPTTTEDSVYIMEGFGFLENNADEVSELEEELENKKDIFFDYGETETYPGYPQPDDHPPAIKLINQIEFDAKLPVKPDPFIIAELHWKENHDHKNDPWWLINDETELSRDQAINNDDFRQKTVLITSGFATPKEVDAIPSLVDNVLQQMNESDNSSYHIFLLPTVYIFVGICVVVVGCSIWCSKASRKKQPDLPKLTYFIQQRQRATEAV